MFDVGFSELALCFLVALIVLGPERLPALARTLGRWTGQARSYLRHLSSELERETNASELKKQLQDARSALQEQAQSVHGAAKKIAASANPTVPPDVPAKKKAEEESSGGPLP